MADISPPPGRWAFRLVPPEPRSIVELIGSGVLDAELAATVWLLVEARVPIVVAAEAQHVGKTTLLAALLDFLPPTIRVVELAGEDETFGWLPQASELGWPGVARPGAAGGDPIRPETTVLLADELSDHTPAYTWGAAARVAVRAASIGYGLAATIHADSLDEVFDPLRRPPVRLTDDELSHLGVVLILAGSTTVAAASSRPTTSGRSPATSTATSSASGRPSSRPGIQRRTRSSTSAGASPRSSRVGSVDGRATSRSSSDRRRSVLETLAGGRHQRPRRGSCRHPRLPPGRGV